MVLRWVFIILSVFTISDARHYAGYKVIRVIPKTHDQLQALESLQKISFDGGGTTLNFWRYPSRVDVPAVLSIAPGDQWSTVLDLLTNAGIDFKVVDGNLEKTINKEKIKLRRLLINSAKQSLWRSFARHSQINEYLDSLADKDGVTVETIGKSYEGRNMNVIIITDGQENSNKISIWIDAGIHAREWITECAALYIIEQLTNGSSESQGLLEKFDWYILPVANPDGYEYSHTTDRLWRKTRKPSGENGYGEKCYGSDPNRNWDNHWNQSSTSTDPCANTYPGNEPFSETETKNIRDYILDHKENLKAYISLHAYSQLILTPLGYSTETPKDNDEIMTIANLAKEAIKSVNGRTFKVGSPAKILYVASGLSTDWARETVGLSYTYTYELYPESESDGGFIVSPDKIPAAVKETWAGIKAMANGIETTQQLE